MAGKQYRITLSEEQLQEWRQVAKTLRHEASFMEEALLRDMVKRYTYSPSCAAMTEGAEVLSKLLSAAKEVPSAPKPTLRERLLGAFRDDF